MRTPSGYYDEIDCDQFELQRTSNVNVKGVHVLSLGEYFNY